MARADVTTLTAALLRAAVLIPFAVCLVDCGGERSAVSSTARADLWLVPSLREIVASSALVGRRVRVTGRCLTSLSAPVLGLLKPVPVVWQLEADGVTVFVAGTPPPECSSPDVFRTVTIAALVAEDTLSALSDLPAAPRRYLVRVEDESH